MFRVVCRNYAGIVGEIGFVTQGGALGYEFTNGITGNRSFYKGKPPGVFPLKCAMDLLTWETEGKFQNEVWELEEVKG